MNLKGSILEFARTSWEITIELAPWLLLGTVMAALLHGLLPQDFVRRHLTGRGSVLKAVLLGVPLPLCSCGVIPAGLGLKKDGASNGASVGFLISTPQTGIDSILVSANFLGWPFALFKVLSATITGLVGGVLADRVETIEGTLDGVGSHGADDRSIAGMVAHGAQLLRSIWAWLFFGIIASAAIQVYIPETWLTEMAALGSLVACLAVLVFSIPLYVCATASVPIAAALVMKGVPASAALVFLMAGPASNMATIGAIYRGFGRKVLGVYLATIALGSIGLMEVGSAVLLLILLGGFALEDLLGWIRKDPTQGATGVIELSVQGMTCGGCVRKLEGKLQEMDGVEAVKVQLDPGLARVHGLVDESSVRQVIEGAGFQAV
jgi:uncharacterized membrane protein YraQ (UPF0718 family)/copper chaperone CopZ